MQTVAQTATISFGFPRGNAVDLRVILVRLFDFVSRLGSEGERTDRELKR